jgi:hypothetical protein
MVPSSSIAVRVDSERLACSGFSLDETVHLENFEFIIDYFSGLSLSPRWSDKGTAFVGSTHRRASTPQRATIEDSTKECLMMSSGEGSFRHPSLDCTAQGLAHPRHNYNMEGERSSHDDVYPTDAGAMAENQLPP